MTVWFTADTHFGHANIIKYCNRGYADAGEMDAALIANWNARVRLDDTVWHLGDFTLGDAETALKYRARLNGKIHLIWGNHDRLAVQRLAIWESSQFATEINLGGNQITLCHYAMRVWNRSHRGALMFYGHSHGTLPGDAQTVDVGVDVWNHCPVTLGEIKARLATLPPREPADQHGKGDAT
jgi:calcineurin-like phosphoesterase family protein